MKTKKSKKADLENKKTYFFLIGLVLSLGLVFLAFEWKTSPSKTIDLGKATFVEPDFFYVPPTHNREKPLPTMTVAPEIIVLVGNDSEVDVNFDAFNTEADNETSIDFDPLIFKPKENKNDKEEEIFLVVEEMPEFPGGDLALRKYLSNAVNYPLIAQENGIEGKVYVSFVIDEMGNITNVDLLRGVDQSLDNEALRVVRTLPKWKPGRQGGKAVKVRYNVPINFQLQ